VYKSSDVDRVVIADIAAEFHEKHLPITLALTKENEKGIPVGILLQFITLTVILIAGVVIPLGMQTIDLEPRLAEALTFSLVGTVLFSLIHFLFDFFKLLNSQIRLKDNS
jgi:amino acid transporter